MLTNEKETMLNKVLQLEWYLEGFLADKIIDDDYLTFKDSQRAKLYFNIKRNLNSIKSLINKS